MQKCAAQPFPLICGGTLLAPEEHDVIRLML